MDELATMFADFPPQYTTNTFFKILSRIITNALQFLWYLYVTKLKPFNLGFPHHEINYNFFIISVWIFI